MVIILRRLLYILVIIGAVVLNFMFVDYQFMLVLIMLAVVLVADYLVYRVSLRKISVSAGNADDYCTLGDKVTVSFACRGKLLNKNSDNRKNKKKGYKIPTGKCKVGVTYSNDGGNVSAVSDIKPVCGHYNYKFKAEHVGNANVCVLSVTVMDYMRMFRRRVDCHYERRLVVHPQVVDLTDSQHSVIEDIELIRQSFYENDNTEVVDLREYQQGDPLGRIHWKLSSLGEEFVVKQFGENVKCTVRIIVDLDTENDRTLLDKIYARSLSLALLCIERGMSGEFIAWDAQYDDYVMLGFTTEDEAYAALEQLYEVRVEADSLKKLERVFGEDAHSIFVTSDTVLSENMV
jgi:uncharacterized protein (DUF58 family)